MRILAMDVGDKRIGIAISDPLGVVACGLGVLERKDDKADLAKIKEVIEKYQPCRIVLGLPKNMNGSIGFQGQKIKKFGDRLKKIYNGEIIYWDERLTTVSATRVMIHANLSRKKRKKKIDQLAAVLILQGYLDYLKNTKKEE